MALTNRVTGVYHTGGTFHENEVYPPVRVRIGAEGGAHVRCGS